MNLIEAKNVSFAYDDETVIRNVSFVIKKGDYVGLIGQNGSGKSTLIKLMLGLIKPKSGSMSLFDTPIASFKDWGKIGYVPQRSGIFDQNFPATVSEIVAMGLVNSRKMEKPDAIIARSLAIVGLSTYGSRQLRELSGGQQQRVLIARALANNPELILLDEPVVGVDAQAQQSFYELLKLLGKTMHITILLISHDLDIVAHESDYLLTLNQGEICPCTREMIEHEKKKFITL